MTNLSTSPVLASRIQTATSLVGDIGGTHTRLCMVADNQLVARTAASFKNADYARFEDVLTTYLARYPVAELGAAALAVAAPVLSDRIGMTNIDWQIDAAEIAAAAGFTSVRLINDFQALALSLRHLAPRQYAAIDGGGMGDPAGVKLVLGAGTGFGASLSILSPDTGRAFTVATESGHVTFLAENEEELALLAFLSQREERPEVESVLSGRGLIALHHFFAQRRGQPQIAASSHRIAEDAIAGTDPIAVEAAHFFLRVLGRTVGDLALAFNATGGVYVSGGAARALAPLFETSGFRRYFEAKGIRSAFMRSIPTYLIADDFAALSGCLERLQQD